MSSLILENMTTTTAERIIGVTDNPTEGVLVTTPTTPEVTTGIPATPIQCMEAVNFTLAFRSENNGANLRPKDGQYNCDTYNMIIAGRPWFRFQAPAGERDRHSYLLITTSSSKILGVFWVHVINNSK